MRSLPDSSPVCWSCRIEWRPSRLLAAALLLLAVLAAGSVMASALPPLPRCLLAGAAFGWGLAAARAAATALPGLLEWAGAGTPARWSRGGRVRLLQDVRVDVRGPLVRVCGRDAQGRVHRLLFWPDTTPSRARRQLRLAAGLRPRSVRPLPPMAA